LDLEAIVRDELKVFSLLAHWPKLAPQDKRQIVEALIEKLVISWGEIDITFSYRTTSEEACKNQEKSGLVRGRKVTGIPITRSQ
jgi:hypothetical protein